MNKAEIEATIEFGTAGDICMIVSAAIAEKIRGDGHSRLRFANGVIADFDLNRVQLLADGRYRLHLSKRRTIDIFGTDKA
jgi:hypothetical protein